MLAVSPLKNEWESEMEGFESMEDDGVEFLDFANGDLLDSIDFDDLFVGIGDGDLLPELVIETAASYDSESRKDDKGSVSASDLCSGSSSFFHGDEIISTNRDERVSPTSSQKLEGQLEKRRKSSASSKNSVGKKKVKVDWTPELHRRFVQAVEQLGIDKAVPSRILELMGIDCLTRHNIASHLQKFRSHRKHLLAREAEAVNWNQRRNMYSSATASTGGAAKKIAPIMGFPPVMHPHFRPLHVWGHPSVDHSYVHMWPLAPSPPPPHAWQPPRPHPIPPPPATDSSYWQSHHRNLPTPGTPSFPTHFPPERFPGARVSGIPLTGKTLPKPPSDFPPSNESINAAIEDVLSKPWLPLPIGLKPPSIDSVMSELQFHGISKIPTPCA